MMVFCLPAVSMERKVFVYFSYTSVSFCFIYSEDLLYPDKGINENVYNLYMSSSLTGPFITVK